MRSIIVTYKSPKKVSDLKTKQFVIQATFDLSKPHIEREKDP